MAPPGNQAANRENKLHPEGILNIILAAISRHTLFIAPRVLIGKDNGFPYSSLFSFWQVPDEKFQRAQV
ncbi:MAG: hypothetical protein ACE5HO_16130 [bacterium]